RAHTAAAHPASTPKPTSSATSSNAASTGSSSFDLATRYAKRAAYYQAELVIAAIVLWLR
ncbi:hypothetical protein, partial [Allokutzneria albata]|uniref:hypothetical protein n=1 Tax=Allokutzneria albata TaxID=211114 RepID=UPI001B80CCC1